MSGLRSMAGKSGLVSGVSTRFSSRRVRSGLPTRSASDFVQSTSNGSHRFWTQVAIADGADCSISFTSTCSFSEQQLRRHIVCRFCHLGRLLIAAVSGWSQSIDQLRVINRLGTDGPSMRRRVESAGAAFFKDRSPLKSSAVLKTQLKRVASSVPQAFGPVQPAKLYQTVSGTFQ